MYIMETSLTLMDAYFLIILETETRASSVSLLCAIWTFFWTMLFEN